MDAALTVRASLACAALVSTLVGGCYAAHEVHAPIDVGPRPDVGAGIDGGRVACSEETLAPYAGPQCSDAVMACRDACGADEPCRDGCIDMPCRNCIYGTILPCANEAGCEALWRTFACCAERAPGCADRWGFERVHCATSCPMEFAPYQQCIEEQGGEQCFLRAARVCGLH